jgi:hypothetical protein
VIFLRKLLILPLISLFILSSCAVTKNGEDLNSFILRMNLRNESYNLSENGFLYDEEKNVFHKFFIIEEQEILLSFKSDDKGRLTQLNFIADYDFYEYEKITLFLENSLYAFINNDDLTINILSESNLFNNLSTKTKNTLKTKNGNIELLLDVTEIGTVITVYKDI